VTASNSAAKLHECTDADKDGTTTDAELPRMVKSSCVSFPDSEAPSLITLESRRDVSRGC